MSSAPLKTASAICALPNDPEVAGNFLTGANSFNPSFISLIEIIGNFSRTY